jgi:hypothetical protein
MRNDGRLNAAAGIRSRRAFAFKSRRRAFTTERRTFTSERRTFTRDGRTFTNDERTFTADEQIFTRKNKRMNRKADSSFYFYTSNARYFCREIFNSSQLTTKLTIAVPP